MEYQVEGICITEFVVCAEIATEKGVIINNFNDAISVKRFRDEF